MLGGRPDRNMVSDTKGLPATWSEKKNLLWTADLGTMTYGNPVVSDGRIYVGTNNGNPRDLAVKGDRGVLMCFSVKDGSFLWQAVHEKLSTGNAEDWAKIGLCSTPCVVGDRVYYVSNRGELVCADALGFTDGENDGVQDEIAPNPDSNGALESGVQTMIWEELDENGDFAPTNIVVGKIEWDADTGGEDIISVVRFLEMDTLSETAFDTLIVAQPPLSSANWDFNKPDLDQSRFGR